MFGKAINDEPYHRGEKAGRWLGEISASWSLNGKRNKGIVNMVIRGKIQVALKFLTTLHALLFWG